MESIENYRNSGYIYGKLEDYSELIDLDGFKQIKNYIDNTNFVRYSRYDYWLKYKDLSYMEELVYSEYLKNDKDLDTADYIYNKAHQYQLKKIEECKFYPTWVFGTSMDSEITNRINNEVLRDFQKNFVRKYYPEKSFNKFTGNTKLQFYDNGCEIKLHDDGQPHNRICVFLYFLNNEWSESNGGYLILHDLNGNDIKVNPIFPNFVVLDSDKNLFHEVEKVQNDIKYNIVSFYAYEN
jgi:Rps23 Pro-64 3,4-dihydroxylase Tpa1-like proline 4-hydroxylase